MPILYDAALVASLYNVGDPLDTTRRVTYSRELFEWDTDWVGSRMAALPPAWITAADIVVVGAGFGWLIEFLIDAGVSSAVGIDPGPYMQANMATESRSDVTVIDATVGVDPINSIKSALRGAGFQRSYDVVIDEDAASSHSDAELQAFYDGCEGLLRGNQINRVVHLVTPISPSGPGDSSLNWKTMAEWKATRPAHTWIDIRTGIEEV